MTNNYLKLTDLPPVVKQCERTASASAAQGDALRLKWTCATTTGTIPLFHRNLWPVYDENPFILIKFAR